MNTIPELKAVCSRISRESMRSNALGWKRAMKRGDTKSAEFYLLSAICHRNISREWFSFRMAAMSPEFQKLDRLIRGETC